MQADEVIHIATIRSLVHYQVKGPLIIGDEGFYELEVHIPRADIEASGDPQGYTNHQVAKHLAACAQRTSVPMNENLWFVQFSPWAQKYLNLPARAFF